MTSPQNGVRWPGRRVAHFPTKTQVFFSAFAADRQFSCRLKHSPTDPLLLTTHHGRRSAEVTPGATTTVHKAHNEYRNFRMAISHQRSGFVTNVAPIRLTTRASRSPPELSPITPPLPQALLPPPRASSRSPKPHWPRPAAP